jgi:hypothetical protein
MTLGSTTLGGNLNLNSNDGAEMFTSFLRTNWTLATGWDATNNGDTNINHNAAGVGTAVLNGVAPTVGVVYKIVITTTYSSGAINYTFGGISGTSLASSGTYTDYICAVTTGALTFVPVTGARGSITAISIIPLFQNGNISTTGKITVNKTNLISNYVNAIELFNNTAATVGVPFQSSPSLVFGANVWQTSTNANQPAYAFFNLNPTSVSANGPCTFRLNFANNAGLLNPVGGMTFTYNSVTNAVSNIGALSIITSTSGFWLSTVSATVRTYLSSSINQYSALTASAGTKVCPSPPYYSAASGWNGSAARTHVYRNYVNPITDTEISEFKTQYSNDAGTTYLDAFSLFGTYGGAAGSVNAVFY